MSRFMCAIVGVLAGIQVGYAWHLASARRMHLRECDRIMRSIAR